MKTVSKTEKALAIFIIAGVIIAMNTWFTYAIITHPEGAWNFLMEANHVLLAIGLVFGIAILGFVIKNSSKQKLVSRLKGIVKTFLEAVIVLWLFAWVGAFNLWEYAKKLNPRNWEWRIGKNAYILKVIWAIIYVIVFQVILYYLYLFQVILIPLFILNWLVIIFFIGGLFLYAWIDKVWVKICGAQLVALTCVYVFVFSILDIISFPIVSLLFSAVALLGLILVIVGVLVVLIPKRKQ